MRKEKKVRKGVKKKGGEEGNDRQETGIGREKKNQGTDFTLKGSTREEWRREIRRSAWN